MFIVTISLVVLVILWYKFTSKSRSKGAPPLPPGPFSLPILGYLPFLSRDLHTQFTDMAKTYGPIFKLMIGSKLHIVINSPELAKVVVRDQVEAFLNRDQSIATNVITNNGEDIAFSPYNANWRLLRKIFVYEMLTTKTLEASVFLRKDEVRKGINNVFVRIGTEVDVRVVALTINTNVLTRPTWGNISDKLAAEIDVVSANIVRLLGQMNLGDIFPSLAPFDLQGTARDMKKQRDLLDQLFTSIIEERIKRNSNRSEDQVEEEGRRDLLEVLLSYKDKNDGTSLSMSQIKSLLLDIMIAGTETTATSVEWAMSCIMQNPNIMKKVQQELTEVVGLDNKVEESHFRKLQYLDAVIKESLRMFPISPFLIPRVSSKECMVGGYTIPKDSAIFLNVWSIHRDPRYWVDPLKFNPDRFLTNKLDFKGNNLMYFPFGSGRRLCPGILLAEKMLMLIIGSLMHSFDWSLPKGVEHDLTGTFFGITLKKRKPLIAIPSKRLADVKLYM